MTNRGPSLPRRLPTLAGVLALSSALLAAGPEGTPGDAAAQPPDPPARVHAASGPLDIREAGAPNKAIHLEVGKSRAYNLTRPVIRVSLTDPQVADVAVLSPSEVLVSGKKTGATSLYLWADQARPVVVDVLVNRDLGSLRARVAEIPGAGDVRLSAVGERVVASGGVPDLQTMDAVASVVRLFDDEFSNLLSIHGDNQVQLEVRFAEVSRTAVRQSGLNAMWDGGDFFVAQTAPGSTQGGGTIFPSAGGLTSRAGAAGIDALSMPSPIGAETFNLFFTAAGIGLNAVLAMLEQEGLSKTLAQPTLVAMSGQEASFLAGGEFPIPAAQTDRTVTIVFKEFGVKLQFLPTVLGASTIDLKVMVEVSDLDYGNEIQLQGVRIPGIVARRGETHLRVNAGESFAIAGLLSDIVRSRVDEVPGLGRIPLLGALFRSTSFKRSESELVVTVTPRLVRPVPEGEMPPLPGEGVLNDPNDIELFFLGLDRSLAGPGGRNSAVAPTGAGTVAGEVGYAR
ncbi:type II and III secretion system protein family protein [Myxococcota bacterium]|nr:type II and III secretion system protein family protein [Myxococcota bacterium]